MMIFETFYSLDFRNHNITFLHCFDDYSMNPKTLFSSISSSLLLLKNLGIVQTFDETSNNLCIKYRVKSLRLGGVGMSPHRVCYLQTLMSRQLLGEISANSNDIRCESDGLNNEYLPLLRRARLRHFASTLFERTRRLNCSNSVPLPSTGQGVTLHLQSISGTIFSLFHCLFVGGWKST